MVDTTTGATASASCTCARRGDPQGSDGAPAVDPRPPRHRRDRRRHLCGPDPRHDRLRPARAHRDVGDRRGRPADRHGHPPALGDPPRVVVGADRQAASHRPRIRVDSRSRARRGRAENAANLPPHVGLFSTARVRASVWRTQRRIARRRSSRGVLCAEDRRPGIRRNAWVAASSPTSRSTTATSSTRRAISKIRIEAPIDRHTPNDERSTAPPKIACACAVTSARDTASSDVAEGSSPKIIRVSSSCASRRSSSRKITVKSDGLSL